LQPFKLPCPLSIHYASSFYALFNLPNIMYML
jgi:hypothetical protein